MKKAYDIWVLIGNVGGFIGLFLGYALMMFPGFLRGIILHFRTLEIYTRGCLIKMCRNVLLHITKMIGPRVKNQAKGQNNRSRP